MIFSEKNLLLDQYQYQQGDLLIAKNGIFPFSLFEKLNAESLRQEKGPPAEEAR